MGGLLAGMGMQLGSNLIEAGANQALAIGADHRQYKLQKKLNLQANELSKEQTDYNMTKQMELWEKTNYDAQKAQMKKAGLNPALMYGMGGSGGATTAVATGHASGGSAQGTSTQMRGMDIASLAQLKLLEAQENKINEEARLAKIQADKLAGADTNKTIAETRGLEIQNAFNMNTFEERQRAITTGVKQQEETLRQSQKTGEIQSATMESQITQIKAEAVGATLTNILLGEQIKNMKEDTKKKIAETLKTDQDVKNSLEQLTLNWKTMGNEKRKIELDAVMKKLQIAYEGFGIFNIKVPIHSVDKYQGEIDEILRTPFSLDQEKNKY